MHSQVEIQLSQLFCPHGQWPTAPMNLQKDSKSIQCSYAFPGTYLQAAAFYRLSDHFHFALSSHKHNRAQAFDRFVHIYAWSNWLMPVVTWSLSSRSRFWGREGGLFVLTGGSPPPHRRRGRGRPPGPGGSSPGPGGSSSTLVGGFASDKPFWGFALVYSNFKERCLTSWLVGRGGSGAMNGRPTGVPSWSFRRFCTGDGKHMGLYDDSAAGS